MAGPAAVVRLGAVSGVVVVVVRLRTAIFQGGLEPEFCLAPAFSRPIRRGTPLGVSQNRPKLEFLLVRLARCGKVESGMAERRKSILLYSCNGEYRRVRKSKFLSLSLLTPNQIVLSHSPFQTSTRLL